jgi:hypothetical protein
MVKTFFAGGLVVSTSFDKFGGEDVVQSIAVRLFFCPFSHSVEHVAVDFDGFVAEGGVVESAEDVDHYFVDLDSGVLPCVENAGCSVLEDGGCNSSGHAV